MFSDEDLENQWGLLPNNSQLLYIKVFPTKSYAMMRSRSHGQRHKRNVLCIPNDYSTKSYFDYDQIDYKRITGMYKSV